MNGSVRDETLSKETERPCPNRERKIGNEALIQELFVAKVETVCALREFLRAVEDGEDGKRMAPMVWFLLTSCGEMYSLSLSWEGG